MHFISDGVALPLSTPLRPFERGVRGRPTLVNNVETLAHAALIARFGSEWFRNAGEAAASGTVLLTVAGAVRRAGALTADSDAVLIGGYFGTWYDAGTAWNVRLDASALRGQGHTLGCGVVRVLPAHTCGVRTSPRRGATAPTCSGCCAGRGWSPGAVRAAIPTGPRKRRVMSIPVASLELPRGRVVGGGSPRSRMRCQHNDYLRLGTSAAGCSRDIPLERGMQAPLAPVVLEGTLRACDR